MKIEVGKAYRTRGGWKAVVDTYDGCEDRPFRAWHEKKQMGLWHEKCGRSRSGEDCDLIAEWSEPAVKFRAGDFVTVKITEEIADYLNDQSGPHHIRRCEVKDHTTAPFDWADVKPGSAVAFEGDIEYFIGWHPVTKTPVLTDGRRSNTLGEKFQNLVGTELIKRATEHDIEVKW